MKILVDMDGVISDFDSRFIQYVESLGYHFDYDTFFKDGDWDISKFIYGVDNPKKLMNSICQKDQFWLTMEPIKDAIPVLRQLNAEHDIRIATTPWTDEPRFKTTKIKWMEKYFRFIKRSQIIFSSSKWELEGAVIVDDKPDTIEKCAGKMTTICFAHSYNRHVRADYRTDNWNEIGKIIEGLGKER